MECIEDESIENLNQKTLDKARKLEKEGASFNLANMNDEMLAIVAKLAGIPFKTAKSAQLGYVVSHFSHSLDTPLNDIASGGKELDHSSLETVGDVLSPYDTLDPDLLATPTLEEELEKQEACAEVDKVLRTLGAREEMVLRMRFGFDDGNPKTLEEIGQKFGVTRERIRQIEAHALKKLKKRMVKKNFEGII